VLAVGGVDLEITKVEIHHYSLQPKTALNRLSTVGARSGTLLRIWFKDLAKPGHADLFPWVELGDLPLGLQLETLKEGTPLPLVAASVLWAYEEARAVAQGVSFFPGTAIPCHTTLLDRSEMNAEVKLAKLKISAHEVANWQDTEEFFKQFPETQWRLDFNGLFHDLNDARDFWEQVSPAARKKIEFLEDPVSEELMASPELKKIFTGSKIALDRHLSEENIKNAHVLVLKPVMFAPDILVAVALGFKGDVVVTSAMDHPLGQLIALRGAQLIQKVIGPRSSAAGLLTHSCYEAHAASSWVKTEKGTLCPTNAGLGWGVRDQLDQLKWEPLT